MRMQLPPSNYPTRRRAAAFLRAAAAAGRGDPRRPERGDSRPACRRSTTRSGGSKSMAAATRTIERPAWVGTVDDHAAAISTCSGVGDHARPRRSTDSRRRAGAENIVISQVMADRFFPGEDPIGRQHPVRAPRERRRTSTDAVRSRGAPSSASARRSCRGDGRCVPQPGGLPAVAADGAADGVAGDSQRAAAGQRHGGGPRRGAVDRCRSAGLHHRNDRGGVRERADRSTGFSRRCSPCSRRSAWCCRRSASTA